jgi:hypothetical protein
MRAGGTALAWAICDECGQRYRRGQLRTRWDGLLVCRADWEPRNPQDFVGDHEFGDPFPVRDPRPETPLPWGAAIPWRMWTTPWSDDAWLP